MAGMDNTDDRHSSPAIMHTAPPPPPPHHFLPAANGHHSRPPVHPASDSSIPTATPMSLPPIHHFEPGGQAPSHPQPPYPPVPQVNGGPHHLMQAPHYIYSFHNGAVPPTMPSNAPNGHNGHNGAMMRFPMHNQPRLDLSNLSAGRHRKDIKRRTKSGCLTCRKRRIKCDETHPACNNCHKSKRECLGYDPIFKRQPGPAPIQPAPSSQPPSSRDKPVFSSAPPVALMPQPRNPHPPTNHSIDSSFANSASLDPALAAAANYHPGDMPQDHYQLDLDPARKVKSISIDQLFSLNDTPPPVLKPEDLSLFTWGADRRDQATVRQKASVLFDKHYARPLDRLFDTDWFSDLGARVLSSDEYLCDYALECTARFQAPNPDHETAQSITSLEAQLIWRLATLPRHPGAPFTSTAAHDVDARALLTRIDTVESLLTGQFLNPDHISHPPYSPDAGSGDPIHGRHAFWHELGELAAARDDSGNPAVVKHVADTLAVIRKGLGVVENRDVLYAIAVARHFGGRLPGWDPARAMPQSTLDRDDDVAKLCVAHRFVRSEDQRGTDVVIQRICSMALRGFSLQHR